MWKAYEYKRERWFGTKEERGLGGLGAASSFFKIIRDNRHREWFTDDIVDEVEKM